MCYYKWLFKYRGIFFVRLIALFVTGPKYVTLPQFWQMIWEQDISIIVMLTNCVERQKV